MAPRGEEPEAFMRLALAEAQRGVGRTSPNPAVGAVVVKRGEVVGSGWHRRAGEPHAEVLALRAAGRRARGADIYTTLEPCNHHGRTPPCSDAILAAGIRRVLCGSADPNPLVNGKGVAKLRRAGVTVIEGLLRAEADALNRPFFKYVRTQLPWVTLKAAVSLDGQMAAVDGSARWVTGPLAREQGHRLRDSHDAVLVGAGTVEADDPRLTVRLGRGEGRNPVRVVLDTHLQLAPSRRVFRTRGVARTIVAATHASPAAIRRFVSSGVEVWEVPARAGKVDLERLLQMLAADGLRSVLVEGGPRVHGAFLEAGLADALHLFIAPKLLGAAGHTWTGGLQIPGIAAAHGCRIDKVEPLGDDLHLEGTFATASLTGSPSRRLPLRSRSR